MSTEVAELRNLRDGRAASERARALGEVRELKKIGDLAAAARRFAQAQGMSEEAKRYAAEMELDAKRYLGEVLREQERQGRGRPKNLRAAEVFPILRDLGLTYNRSSEAQQLAAIPDGDYEAFKTGARSDTLTTKGALRAAREREAERRRQGHVAPVTVSPGGIEIRHGDLRCALDDLSGSVDAIITDPPYAAEFLAEFDALSQVAARLLKPTGVLAAMVGQAHLPQYIARLGRQLTYRWCAAYLTPGGATRVHGRAVATSWKPVLIYQGTRFLTQDVFVSGGDDKRHHHWGQSESGTAGLVERLTMPGELVVDPFLGGGTTAIVCRDLGRRFVGCDIDVAAIRAVQRRLAA